MKIFFSTRKIARDFKGTHITRAVVDHSKTPSLNGSRWAVDLKRKAAQ